MNETLRRTILALLVFTLASPGLIRLSLAQSGRGRPATRQRQVTREAADAAANRQEHVKLRREYLQTVQSLQELEAEVQQHKAEDWELNVGVLEELLKSVSGNLKDGSPAPHLEPAERAKEYADFLDKAWKTIRIIRDNGVTGEKIDQAEFRLENLKSHVS